MRSTRKVVEKLVNEEEKEEKELKGAENHIEEDFADHAGANHAVADKKSKKFLINTFIFNFSFYIKLQYLI